MAETTDVPELNEADRQRFDSKVKRGHESACWPWAGPCDAGKRPSFVTSRAAGQRRISARRVMWAVSNGGSARGQYVLSSCQNPKCMNPKHLFLSPVADGVASTGKRAARAARVAPALAVAAPAAGPAGPISTDSFDGFGAIRSFDALDALTESSAEAIRAGIRAAEVRIQTLRALLGLALNRPAPKVPPTAVPPRPAAQVKRLVQKPPVKKSAPAPAPTETARRVMFIARDRTPRSVAHLASLLRITNDAVRTVCRSASALLSCDERDQVTITDEGLSWLLREEVERA